MKIIRYIKAKASNFKYNWGYLGVLNSPFVGLTTKWYFGEIKYGTPYFLPRKWVKCDRDDALKSWYKQNKHLFDEPPKNSIESSTRDKYKEYWIKDYIKNHIKPVPIKYFGFDYTSLGWKTKYEDIRFEWSPSISLVIFGKQLFISVIPKLRKTPEDTTMLVDLYWEAYLTYKYRTDKSKSKQERLEQTMKLYSCTWGNKENGYFDYYTLILKQKYIKNEIKRTKKH